MNKLSLSCLLACLFLSLATIECDGGMSQRTLLISKHHGVGARAQVGHGCFTVIRRLILHGGAGEDSDPPLKLLETLMRERKNLRPDEWFYMEKRRGRYEANGPIDGDWISTQLEMEMMRPDTRLWRPGMNRFAKARELRRFLPEKESELGTSFAEEPSASERVLLDESTMSEDEKARGWQEKRMSNTNRKWKTRRLYVDSHSSGPHGGEEEEEEEEEEDSNCMVMEEGEVLKTPLGEEDLHELAEQQTLREGERRKGTERRRDTKGRGRGRSRTEFKDEERMSEMRTAEEQRGSATKGKGKKEGPQIFADMTPYKSLLNIPDPKTDFEILHKELREIGIIYLLR
eukprot:761195-Hanusia_phi.AAC.1